MPYTHAQCGGTLKRTDKPGQFLCQKCHALIAIGRHGSYGHRPGYIQAQLKGGQPK